MISLLQVLKPMGAVFEISYPSLYLEVLDWLSLVELDFFSLNLGPFACLVDSLRRYDLAAQEQDVTDTLTKLRSPSSDGEDDFSRAWRPV